MIVGRVDPYCHKSLDCWPKKRQHLALKFSEILFDSRKHVFEVSFVDRGDCEGLEIAVFD